MPRIPFNVRALEEAQEESSNKMRYIVGNGSRHKIGWCRIEHIYGRLVKVEEDE